MGVRSRGGGRLSDGTVTLPERPPGEPLVSVVMPCLNHGRYLAAAMGSIRAQDYPDVEVVLVDDGSTDPDTIAELDRLAEDPHVVLERLPRNVGPAAARNAGVELARGRYVLPVDVDNRLLPRAVRELVAQLREAPPDVGFIYPNKQFFGNRHDRWQAPPYNLYTLLFGNYCDTCSLIDRSVFDAGFRYPEGVHREDWHFVLTLAEHGVHGEPARTDTLLFRQRGFNRSDLVGHARRGRELDDVVARMHPQLLGSPERIAEIKARWAPSASVVVLGTPAPEAIAQALAKQTCIDAEALVPAAPTSVAVEERGCLVRGLGASGDERALLEAAVAAARGRVIVAVAAGSTLLDDPSAIEKLLRLLDGQGKLRAVALAAESRDGLHPWAVLESTPDEPPHAVAFRRESGTELEMPAGDLLFSLAVALAHATESGWRALPGSTTAMPLEAGGRLAIPPAPRPEAGTRAPSAPLLPGQDRESPPRSASRWLPPLTAVLSRFVERSSGRRLVTTDGVAPPGFALEHRIGAIRHRPLPNTCRLTVNGPAAAMDVSFATRPEEEPLSGGESTLGFLELAALPMLSPVKVVRVRGTGQLTLSGGPEDPLTGRADVEAHLGWIEPFPLLPLEAAHADVPADCVGLLRAVDLGRGRHVYAAEAQPPGTLAGELGALARRPAPGCTPVWLQDGYVLTPAVRPPSRPSLRATSRWAASPWRWHDSQHTLRRATAVARRLPRAVAAAARHPDRHPRPDGEPVGYLYADERPKRSPLFSAWHPATGDQLVTTSRREAALLGYGEPVLLGYVLRYAPVTGVPWGSAMRPVRIPWAWRDGAAVSSDRSA